MELLVVMSIMSLLIALLLPALARAQESARAIKCASNARQVEEACLFYASDNRNVILKAADNPGLYTDYTVHLDKTSYIAVNSGVWYCPSNQTRNYKSFIVNRYPCGSNLYSPTKWTRYDDVKHPVQVIHFADMVESPGVLGPQYAIDEGLQVARIATRHDDANIMFIDGHAKLMRLTFPTSYFYP